jgi:hypothetical protein
VSTRDSKSSTITFNIVIVSPEDGRVVRVSDSDNEYTYSSLDEMMSATGLSTNIHGKIELDYDNSVKNPELVNLIQEKYLDLYKDCSSFESVIMYFKSRHSSFDIDFVKIGTNMIGQFDEYGQPSITSRVDISTISTTSISSNRNNIYPTDSRCIYSFRELFSTMQLFLNRIISEISFNYSIVKNARDMYTDNMSLSRHPDYMGMD